MIEGKTLVCTVSLYSNDGQTSIDSIEEYKCEKYHQFLPAGETKHGVRKDPIIQFWSERFIDPRGGHDRYGFLRTVSTMSVVAIKGVSQEQIDAIRQKQQKKPVVKARTRAQRLALRGK